MFIAAYATLSSGSESVLNTCVVVTSNAGVEGKRKLIMIQRIPQTGLIRSAGQLANPCIPERPRPPIRWSILYLRGQYLSCQDDGKSELQRARMGPVAARRHSRDSGIQRLSELPWVPAFVE